MKREVSLGGERMRQGRCARQKTPLEKKEEVKKEEARKAQ